MVWIGKDPKVHLVPAPLQGHLSLHQVACLAIKILWQGQQDNWMQWKEKYLLSSQENCPPVRFSQSQKSFPWLASYHVSFDHLPPSMSCLEPHFAVLFFTSSLWHALWSQALHLQSPRGKQETHVETGDDCAIQRFKCLLDAQGFELALSGVCNSTWKAQTPCKANLKYLRSPRKINTFFFLVEYFDLTLTTNIMPLVKSSRWPGWWQLLHLDVQSTLGSLDLQG